MPEEPENTTEPAAETVEPAEEPNTDPAEETGETTEDAQAAPEGEPTGEPFDRARAEAKIRKANKEAEGLRKRLKELEPAAAELQRIKDADKTESERLNDQLERAKQQIEKTRTRLVTARVQVLAKAFVDPDDALGELDLASYLDDDGDVDDAAIEADLQALLQRKPHWAKPNPATPPEGPRRPAPDLTQGSGANKKRSTPTPADEFQGWLTSQLK